MNVSRLWRAVLLALLATALQLSGCSSTPSDQAPLSTGEALYKEAREEMDSGNFAAAIKTLARVEGLAAGSCWRSRLCWTWPT